MKGSDSLFVEEEALAGKFRQLTATEHHKLPAHQRDLHDLAVKYQELLDQAKFLTRISDRLENKLESKNRELTKALDDLRRARVGKKARTIVYLIAAFLFVFEELFVEPVLVMAGSVMMTGLLVKLLIALLLKPTETILENLFLNRIKN